MAEKKVDTRVLANSLAKELGYKNLDDFKQALEQRTPKSLKARLESGEGFGAAIANTASHKVETLKSNLSASGIKRKAKGVAKKTYNEFFKGDDIFSAYMRGRLNKKADVKDAPSEKGEEKESTSPTLEKESGGGFGAAIANNASDKIETLKSNLSASGIKRNVKGVAKKTYNEFFKGGVKDAPSEKGEEKGGGTLGKDGNALLKIIAKNCLSLHLMSRDMNVFRQNMKELLDLENQKLKPKEQKKSREEADTWFLKADEREAKLEEDRKKYTQKQEEKESTSPTPEKESGGGFLSSIVGMLKDGLMSGFRALFNPGAILKVLGKVFVFATLIISLFKGITAAFERWQETGSIKEAIIAGLGAIVDFLTFGFFGEDTVRSLFGAVEEFIGPIIDTFSNVFNTVKDWIANTVGIPEIKMGSLTIYNPIPGSKDWVIDLPTIGPYYPFKDNPKSSEKQVTPKKETPKKEEGGTSDKKTSTGDKSEGGVEAKKEDSKKADLDKAKQSYDELMTINSDLKKLESDYNKEFFAAKTDEERQDINEKYSALFDEKKKKLKKLQSVPGVKDLLGNQKLNLDVDINKTSPKQVSTKTPDSLVPDSSAAVSGMSGDAKNASDKLSEMDKKHSDARLELANSLGSDALSSNEMKTLVLEQQKERAELLSKILPEQKSPSAASSSDVAPSSAGISSESSSPTPAASGTPSGSVDVPAPEGGTTEATGSVSGTPTAPSASETTPTSPSTETPPPMTSGGDLAASSVEVAEAQRMEASADMGSEINAPTTNNTSGSVGNEPSKVGEVYDTEFAEYYAST